MSRIPTGTLLIEVDPNKYEYIIFLLYALSSVETYYSIIEKEYLVIIKYLEEVQ